jgi:hypothetical protein
MDELDRLYRLLVETIKAQHPELLTRPFEVADVYQSILPYRLHRRALGMETNSDYEMTLLRLLSGERGYIIGDDDVQDAFRRELATPNPDPGAFRPYAQSHVALAADALRKLEQGGVAAMAGAGRAMPTPAATPTAPPRASASQAFAPPAAAPLRPPMPPAPPPAPAASAAPMRSPVTNPSLQQTMSAPPRSTTAEALGGRCRYCSGALPAGRRLTYCPHCGQNLTVQHCPACNTELEVGWKFCTTCGRGVSGA